MPVPSRISWTLSKTLITSKRTVVGLVSLSHLNSWEMPGFTCVKIGSSPVLAKPLRNCHARSLQQYLVERRVGNLGRRFSRAALKPFVLLAIGFSAGGWLQGRAPSRYPNILFSRSPASGESTVRPTIGRILFVASAALANQAAFECARGQVTLPQITVTPS
jgi:hypothetical protein